MTMMTLVASSKIAGHSDPMDPPISLSVIFASFFLRMCRNESKNNVNETKESDKINNKKTFFFKSFFFSFLFLFSLSFSSLHKVLD